MFISNTYITDNSSPARILPFKKCKLQPSTDVDVVFCHVMLCFGLMPTLYLSTNHKVSSVLASGLAILSQGGGGGDTPLFSNLKVIAVPVLATILHMVPLRFKNLEL